MFISRFISIFIGIVYTVHLIEILAAPAKRSPGNDDFQTGPIPREQSVAEIEAALKELQTLLKDANNPIVKEFVQILNQTKASDLDSMNRIINSFQGLFSPGIYYAKCNSKGECSTNCEPLKDIIAEFKNFMKNTRVKELQQNRPKVHEHSIGDIQGALKEMQDLLKDAKHPIVIEFAEMLKKTKASDIDSLAKLVNSFNRLFDPLSELISEFHKLLRQLRPCLNRNQRSEQTPPRQRSPEQPRKRGDGQNQKNGDDVRRSKI